MSQKPARQKPLQHCASAVHVPDTGTQVVVTTPHTPLVQAPPQQSAAVAQAPPSAVHGVLQVWVVASQTPWQQSLSTAHDAPWVWHVSGGSPQRGGLMDSSQTMEQQPLPGPELHVSPVGRQSVLV